MQGSKRGAHRKNRLLVPVREGAGGRLERAVLKRTLPHVKQPVGTCYMMQETHSVTTQRGGVGREVGRRFKREGPCVCLWLFHA